MKNFSGLHPEECWEAAYKAGIRGLTRTPSTLDDEVCQRAWHEGWEEGHAAHIRDITPEIMRKHGALAALMADEPMTPPTDYPQALLVEWRRGFDAVANFVVSEYLQNRSAKRAYEAGARAAFCDVDRIVPAHYAQQWSQITAWLAAYDNVMAGMNYAS